MATSSNQTFQKWCRRCLNKLLLIFNKIRKVVAEAKNINMFKTELDEVWKTCPKFLRADLPANLYFFSNNENIS